MRVQFVDICQRKQYPHLRSHGGLNVKHLSRQQDPSLRSLVSQTIFRKRRIDVISLRQFLCKVSQPFRIPHIRIHVDLS